MTRLAASILAVALILVPLPAQAHNEAELEAWVNDWTARASIGEMTPILLDEWLDMAERHPCREHFYCPPRRSSAQSGSTKRISYRSGVEQWRALVELYFPANQVELALCIMDKESGGNPYADNPRSTAAGLFQFLRSTWDDMIPRSVTGGSYSSGAIWIPDNNVRAAAWLANNVGWSQWNPYKRGACR